MLAVTPPAARTTRRFAACSGLLALVAGCFVDAGHVGSGPGGETSGAGETSSSTGTSTGEPPTGSSGAVTTTTPPHCGDAIQDPDEECDYGADINGIDGSFCRDDCTSNLCGDAYLASNEACDDGNLAPGDGCSASCKLESCGDGAPGPGEQCDDGNLDDNDACTSLCKPAVCGDGLVQSGVEACDDGNPDLGDGCTPACELEVCGNGVLEGNEACDDGDLVDGDGCSATCQRDAYFVFVTSQRYAGTFGGLTEADAHCAELATAAGLPGLYMAWLSEDKDCPATRFVQSSIPYVLPDGSQVASDWSDLIKGSLAHPIDQTETGQTLPASQPCTPESATWTNTRTEGTPVNPDSDCLGWTFPINNSRTGDPHSQASGWTNNCSLPCQTALRFYCFEQGT